MSYAITQQYLIGRLLFPYSVGWHIFITLRRIGGAIRREKVASMSVSLCTSWK